MKTIEATAGETIWKLAERAINTLQILKEPSCEILHNTLRVRVYSDSSASDVCEKWDMQRQIQWGHKPWGEH